MDESLYNKLDVEDNRLYLEKGYRTLVHENILNKYRVKETVYFRNDKHHSYVISIDKYDEHYRITEEIIIGTVEFHEMLNEYIFYAESRTNAFTHQGLLDISTILATINADYIREQKYNIN